MEFMNENCTMGDEELNEILEGDTIVLNDDSLQESIKK